MRWEVKKVEGEKLDLVTSGGKELSTGFTAHGQNFVIEAERPEAGEAAIDTCISGSFQVPVSCRGPNREHLQLL